MERDKGADDLTEEGVTDMRDEPARDEDIDDVITKINHLKDYEGPMSFYGLKTLMDEANYEAYVAAKALHEKIGADKDLNDYFRTVYPLPVIDEYIALFGNPNLYLVRKMYTDEVDCTVPTEIVKVLKDYKSNINLKQLIASSVGPAPVVPKPAKPQPTKPTGRFARNLKEAKYVGVLLDSINLQWPYANPIFIFEDAKGGPSNKLRDLTYK